MSIGALVSMFLCLVVGIVDALSMMRFSHTEGLSSHDIVVPRNLKFNRLSGINFFIASNLFLISDLVELVLELVCLFDERPHVVSSRVSFSSGNRFSRRG